MLQYSLYIVTYGYSKEEETRLEFTHFCHPASASQTFDLVVNNRNGWWKQVQSTVSLDFHVLMHCIIQYQQH